MNVSSFKDTFTVDFLGKKERFSRLQVEQDTWEQDNFDDCCYNFMVLVKGKNELP